MSFKELSDKLDAWALEHRAELVADVISLVNIKSVQSDPVGDYPFGEGAARVIEKGIEYGEKYGYKTENDGYYTLSFLRSGATARELGIMGHVDVVPEGDGWKYEPYNAVEAHGHIVGRGSSDDKGPCVAALYALRALDAFDIKLNHTVRLIWGANEETGMEDVKHFAATHEVPEYTLVCDSAYPVCYGEKGIITADLTYDIGDSELLDFHGGEASNSVPDSAYVILKMDEADVIKALAGQAVEISAAPGGVKIFTRGIAGHAGHPEGSVNAIGKLAAIVTEAKLLSGKAREAVAIIAKILADFKGAGLDIEFEDEVSGYTTHVGGMISLKGGILRQNVNIRYSVTADSDDLHARMEKAVAGYGFSLENFDNSPARWSELNDPRVQLLLETAREFISPDMEAYTMAGGTHARYLPNAIPFGAGIMHPKNPPPVKFGGAHGPDEGVSIESLLLTVKIYAIALMRLDELLK